MVTRYYQQQIVSASCGISWESINIRGAL